MKLNDWLTEEANAAEDPEICTLPGKEFSAAELSIAIAGMGCHISAGQFGYLSQLANNPTAAVARDALEQIKPAHPGNVASAEDGAEWEAFAAAHADWARVRNAFPTAWLLYK